jgi:hypothetical protein
MLLRIVMIVVSDKVIGELVAVKILTRELQQGVRPAGIRNRGPDRIGRARTDYGGIDSKILLRFSKGFRYKKMWPQ